MRILLLDSDTTAARSLHTKLLTYKGTYWDLEHFDSPESASSALIRDSFDVVIAHLRGNELVEGELLNFIEAARIFPILGLLEPQFAEFDSQWIKLGFSDILIHENISADQLMRRLRLSVARWDRQSQDLQSAKTRLQFAASSVLAAPSTSDSPTNTEQHSPVEERPIESRLIERHFLQGQKQVIAVLRDHGTPRLLEGAEDEVEIEVFRDFKSYAQAVQNQPARYSAGLIEQDLLEREGNRVFERCELRFPGPPLILVASDRSDASAVSQVAEGFDDCLPSRGATTSSLLRAIRLSLARWEYAREQVQQAIRTAPQTPDRRQAARGGRDRRVGSRYLVTRPLLAIPILADGSPDRANIRDAFSIDIAMGGMGFQISNHSGIPGRNWILGVETDLGDGFGERFHYSHVIVRNVSYPQGGVRMGAQFQVPANDLLHSDNLMPSLNLETGSFQHKLHGRAIEQWIELGVLRPKLLHRVNTCPECRAVASSGRGCHDCGSPDIRFKELIHHFACAAVDDAAEFQRNGELCCPKCLSKSLVIGVDFELIASQYECQDCSHSGSQIADVSTCLKCRLRFPSTIAVEEEVYSYDVDRLDILALLNATD